MLEVRDEIKFLFSISNSTGIKLNTLHLQFSFQVLCCIHGIFLQPASIMQQRT